MRLCSSVVILLSLSSNFACRMLYITGDQDPSSTDSTSLEAASQADTDGTGTTLGVTGTSTSAMTGDETGTSLSPTSNAADTTSGKTTGETSSSTAGDTSCSDGDLDRDEECDSQGCDAKSCTPLCGNGILDALEECDDGHELNSDAQQSFCSATCFRNGLLAFVTHDANFGGVITYKKLLGVDAAIEFCKDASQSIPEASFESGNFYPWISTRDGLDEKKVTFSPLTNYSFGCHKPYYLPKEKQTGIRPLIALNFSDLTLHNNDEDPFLLHSISITEEGKMLDPLTDTQLVITGTEASGEVSDLGDCEDFSEFSGKVRHGSPFSTDQSWTSIDDDTEYTCLTENSRLYCFEQCPQ